MSRFLCRQTQLHRERLPHELFYGFIIPVLLTDYIHQYIVHNKQQNWNPFFHLPLVCRRFNRSCQLLAYQIFHAGEHNEGDTGPPIPPFELLEYTSTLWRKAHELPSHSEYPEYTYGELESAPNLIQVYICAGLAKYFYAIDILRPIILENWRDEFDEPPTPAIEGDPDMDIPNSYRFRRHRMSHDRMHRFHLPFMCAIRVCDSIKNDVLAEPIAGYLAEKAVTYGTEPVLLQRIQDLEMNMTRIYTDNLTLRARWTEEALDRIADRKGFLKNIQTHGKLVSQYCVVPSDLTKRTIERTEALSILEVVASLNWGTRTTSIRGKATSIICEFREICERGTGGPMIISK